MLGKLINTQLQDGRQRRRRIVIGPVRFTPLGCAQEAQAKHQEFMNVAILLAQKDTQRYQAVAQAMQTELPELQKANDFEKLCAFYDEWIAKMK